MIPHALRDSFTFKLRETRGNVHHCPAHGGRGVELLLNADKRGVHAVQLFNKALLTVIRTVGLFVPLGFLFSRFGLNWFRLAFPVTELLTSAIGMMCYHRFLAKDYVRTEKPILPDSEEEIALKLSIIYGSA